MGRKKGEPAGVDEKSFATLRDKIDQVLQDKEPHAKKRKPEEDATVKQSPRKKQQRKKPGSDSAGVEEPQENGAQTQIRAQADSHETLLGEIRALGGDEDDLDLVMGVDSESENEYDDSSAPISRGIQKELLKFATELGFPQSGMADEPSDPNTAVAEEEPEEPAEAPDAGRPVPAGKKMTIFEPRADWHAAPLGELPSPVSDDVSPYRGAISALQKHAQKLLDDDSTGYATTFFASSTHKFLSTIMASGTMNDKVSALTLAVQESPIHNVRALEALMGLAGKKNRSQSIIALAAVVDLMGQGLVLPPDRKLRAFGNQPALVGALQQASCFTWDPALKLPGGITAPHLMSWVYEDWLKTTYFKLIQLLEIWCGDEIDYSRIRALDFIFGLLREKPEQEVNLLRLLVNRLGDKDRKISSRASYLLLQLHGTHPGMKSVIIQTIEHEIILRPGQPLRARYYAINTLNQTILSTKETSVSESLLKIYFGIFTTMLKSGEMGTIPQNSETFDKKPEAKNRQRKTMVAKPGNDEDLAEKVVSAVLTGINRAVPFADGNDDVLESQMDTLFRIAHSSNFNTSIQALLLIQQLVSTKGFAADRFYRVLYESLLDPRLPSSSKQAMYLNLLLRALKSDINMKRVKAFMKRMLQGLALHQPPFACGVLYVISQLRRSLPGLSTLIEEPEENKEQLESGEGEPGAPDPLAGQRYDGRKRDPEYSNADNTCLWEIVPSLHHYHPAVLVYASAVMDSDVKTEKPDLESHSLIRFLDKFAYRNAKTKEATRGGSIMQPLQVSNSSSDMWLRSKSAQASGVSVNSASFWQKKVENVAAEDVFFHEYFSQTGRTGNTLPRRVAAEPEADAEPVDEDDVWKALTDGHGDDEAALDDMEEDDESDLPDWDSSSESDEGEEGDGDGDDDDVDDLTAAGLDLGLEDDDDDVVDDGGDDDGGDEDADKTAKPKSRRQRIRELPMFASIDDYADLLADEDEGM